MALRGLFCLVLVQAATALLDSPALVTSGAAHARPPNRAAWCLEQQRRRRPALRMALHPHPEVAEAMQQQREQPAQAQPPHRVIFMRHGESTYNAEGRFIGWADPPLSALGEQEARAAATLLREHGVADSIDEVFVSYLKRSIKTGWLVADEIGKAHMPVTQDWRLNEQMYGDLQGKLKREVAREHGVELTQKWRRSYDIAPPPVPGAKGYFPSCAQYAALTEDDVPESWCGSAQTESLKDTQSRAWRLWKERIAPAARAGRTVLVVAHGNVIRAMLKRLDNIDNDRLRNVCIPRAVPLVYDLDALLRPVRSAHALGPLSCRYLASPRHIAAQLLLESDAAQLGLRQSNGSGGGATSTDDSNGIGSSGGAKPTPA